MTCTLHVAWDDRLSDYDFGPGHPMAPLRLKLTMELAGVWGSAGTQDGVIDRGPGRGQRRRARTHSRARTTSPWCAWLAIRPAEGGARPGELTTRALLMHGLGTEDDPVFPDMHTAARGYGGHRGRGPGGLAVGGPARGTSPAACTTRWPGTRGFCVYNDPAVAIAWLLRQGAERIAYVDVDVHHGDGVQAAFYDDPRVLTISLHESPRTLFPGTGTPDETGGPGAEGGAVNLAFPQRTRDDGWLRGLRRGGPAAAAELPPR